MQVSVQILIYTICRVVFKSISGWIEENVWATSREWHQ